MEARTEERERLTKQLRQSAEAFFNSVEAAFLYARKKDILGSFLGLIVLALFFFLAVSILNVIPKKLSESMAQLYGASTKVLGINIPLDSNLFWWIACTTTGIILFRASISAVNKLEAHRKEKGLPQSQLAFCHLFKAVKEVSAYSVNQRRLHLETARKHLTRYMRLSGARIPSATLRKYVRGEVEKVNVQVYNLVRLLQDNYFWFELGDTANLIASAYKDIEIKLLERVEQEVEVDLALQALELLALYEYSLVKRPVESRLEGSETTVESFGRTLLVEFATLVSKIAPLEKAEPAKKPKTLSQLSSRIFGTVRGWLQHSSIIVCFVSWYLFLSIVFSIPLLVITIGVLQLQMDSTLIVGILATPFAAAIAVATTVFTRSSKHE